MSTTKRNSIFKTLVSNVDSTEGLEAEKGALVNHSGALKMGDGSTFNEIGGGGPSLSGLFTIQGVGGIQFTLDTTYDGSFEGWTFNTQLGPNRWNLVSPTGFFLNYSRVLVRVNTAVTGGGVVSSSESYITKASVFSNTLTLTQIYNVSNGSFSEITGTGSPLNVYIEIYLTA